MLLPMKGLKGERNVLLHNIRSAHNVGAILRTADALGVEKVYLTGYTPCPLDRFGRPDPRIAKTALGAERTLSVEYQKDPMPLIDDLRKKGVRVIGVEQDMHAVDYKSHEEALGERELLIMGNEVRGMSPALKRKCDALLEIPMRGKKESLNVAVAFGVVAYRIWDRK